MTVVAGRGWTVVCCASRLRCYPTSPMSATGPSSSASSLQTTPLMFLKTCALTQVVLTLATLLFLNSSLQNYCQIVKGLQNLSRFSEDFTWNMCRSNDVDGSLRETTRGRNLQFDEFHKPYYWKLTLQALGFGLSSLRNVCRFSGWHVLFSG